MQCGWKAIDKVSSSLILANCLDHRLLLVVATNLSRVVAFDLRSMEILFSLQNPPHHGTPTCFCIDKSRRTWLLLSTSRGILDLWDLRFLLRLKAWGLPPYNGIKRLQVHPTRGHGKWVCVSGGTSHGEITVWDIDKLQCREVYRANGSQDTPRNYDAYRIDDDKPEGPLGRFAVDPDHKLDNGLGSGAEWRVYNLCRSRSKSQILGPWQGRGVVGGIWIGCGGGETDVFVNAGVTITQYHHGTEIITLEYDESERKCKV